MVHGVELPASHEPQQVRELKARDAIGLEENREARDKIVDVGHVRENVVGDGQVRAAIAGNQQFGEAAPKEFLDDLEPLPASRLRGARGWLDAVQGMPRAATY